ncbi:MAG: molybdopterin molybdotransferase MoeA, partial [Betaproteobacteria bacterium]|nr:molybdopterin molybdotransferase MoeA [Betaproteobacteria bacterium]
MLSIEEALQNLLSASRPVADLESLPLALAQGRVLATPLMSKVSVPPLDNSAMDGYAVRWEEWAEDRHFTVSQRIPAGHLGTDLEPGTVARIFTGAPIPPGANSVVMQEDCVAVGEAIRISRPPRPDEHIRRAGEDFAEGQTILAAGTRLGPAQLGLAAAAGAALLNVFRPLKVAVFFTGDELKAPGEALGPGQIYNSNRASLTALLHQMGCHVIDLGDVPDTLEATHAALEQAAASADVIVTSGGVSVGEEDHVKAALIQIGRLDMWKVAMKPGKPLAFGRIGNTDFLGLPGNPVSAFVVFCLFARPFLQARMGMTPEA